MKYQLKLEGHPARESIPKEVRLPAIGVYRSAVHYYPAQSCKELDRLKTFTKRFKGKVKRVVAVSRELASMLNDAQVLNEENCLGSNEVMVAVAKRHQKLIPRQLQSGTIKEFKMVDGKQQCFILKSK